MADHARRGATSRWRLVAAAAVAVTLGLALTANAGATLYSAKIAPDTATAGSTATYTFTIRNLLGPAMGSANVQVPAGWTDASVGAPVVYKANGDASARVWTAQLDGSTLKLRASGSGPENKVLFLWKVQVSVTVTAQCSAGESIWKTAAKTGSDFTGISFVLFGPKPKVTVSGSCAHHLDFDQQPTDTALGEAIAPPVTVRVEDAGGNLVDFDGPVTVTLAGPGSFTDSTPMVNAVDGLATFSNLKIDAAGTYTLMATSGALDPDTSDEFEVVYAQTVLEDLEPGTAAEGTNCDETGDATAEIPSCVGVDLPNGANGSVELITSGPIPGAPEGTNTFNSVLGDFKSDGGPLYDAEHPATIILEIDEANLPGCDGGFDRALQGYYVGDYYPFRATELLFQEPRTCLELFVQFSDEGAWHSVPVCREPHDEYFDSFPDGDEYFWYDGELGFGSLFDEDEEEGFDAGACMAASHFDGQDDLILYVLFFGDPRLSTK